MSRDEVRRHVLDMTSPEHPEHAIAATLGNDFVTLSLVNARLSLAYLEDLAQPCEEECVHPVHCEAERRLIASDARVEALREYVEQLTESLVDFVIFIRGCRCDACQRDAADMN